MLYLLTCVIDGEIRRFVTAANDIEQALIKVQRLVGPDGIEGDIAITQLSDFLTDIAELPTIDRLIQIGENVGPDGWRYPEPSDRVTDLDGPSAVAGYDLGDLRRKAELLEVPKEY